MVVPGNERRSMRARRSFPGTTMIAAARNAARRTLRTSFAPLRLCVRSSAPRRETMPPAMSSRITPADVDRLATLARLELTDDERARLAAELPAILDYAAQVLEVDTADVPPMSHVAGAAATPLRADEPRPSLQREDVLTAAADRDPATGLFKVPRVIGP